MMTSQAELTLYERITAHLARLLMLPLFGLLWVASRFRLPFWILSALTEKAYEILESRTFDLRIPADPNKPVYMERWWLVKNRFISIYLHRIWRSDDDRALHDHPWMNFSLLLDGAYREHRILNGGIHTLDHYQEGDMKVRWTGKYAHRLQLHESGSWGTEKPVTTLFITGPIQRRWGFHADDYGWIDSRNWEAFCKARANNAGQQWT